MKGRIKFYLVIVLASFLLSSCASFEEHFFPKHVVLATKLEERSAYHIFHVRAKSDGRAIEFYTLPKRLEGLPPEGDPGYKVAKQTLRQAELQYFVERALKESVNSGYEGVFIYFSKPEKVVLLEGQEGTVARTYVILKVRKEDVVRYFEEEERDYEAYFVRYFSDFVFVWPWGIPFRGKANHWKASDAETLDWGN